MDPHFERIAEADVNLEPYNTMGLSAKAQWFVPVEDERRLTDLLQDPQIKERPVLILGGGSNILFADDFEGVVLHIRISGRQVIHETDEEVLLKIGGGENWHETVRYCVRHGWGGVENLSLIPGTVGAAPIQNIGAYGVELKDVFESLEAIHLESGERRTVTKEECRFGYRDSIFKNEWKGQFIITRVTLRLSNNPQVNTSYGAISDKLEERNITDPTIADISNIVTEIRNSKLPNPELLGNTGSFFKNPVVDHHVFERIKEHYPGVPGYSMPDGKIKIPAGWLIEQAGWKGKCIGEAGTYKKQALVIVNHGGATGKEVLQLADTIQNSVKRKFGLKLTPEVNIIR